MLQESALAKRHYSRTDEAAVTGNVFLTEQEAIVAVQEGNRKAYRVVVEQYMKQAYYIALGFVQRPHHAIGTRVAVKIRERAIEAEIARRPFYWQRTWQPRSTEDGAAGGSCS